MEMPQTRLLSRACTFERVLMFVLGLLRLHNCEFMLGLASASTSREKSKSTSRPSDDFYATRRDRDHPVDREKRASHVI